jgi:hypothetical protein
MTRTPPSEVFWIPDQQSVATVYPRCIAAVFSENVASRSASAREGHEPPLVFGDLSELGSQGSSWTALSADAAVDIFMTNRPLRFFTGMKSKCL